MMRDEEAEDDMDDMSEGMTYEEFSENLYRERHLPYHTEVIKPDAFTSMDDYGVYTMTAISPRIGLMILNHQNNYRINMVAFKRKRSDETVAIAKGNTDDRKRREDLKTVLRGMND